MTIADSLLVGLMADKIVDDVLVNSLAGQRGLNEAVPKRVPSFDDGPFAAFERRHRALWVAWTDMGFVPSPKR